jgi:hypothetical protein
VSGSDNRSSSLLFPVGRADGRPFVVGEPRHETAEGLVERYRGEALAEFLASEALEACGDYVLVDPEGADTRLVTSPGYAGGYVYEPAAGDGRGSGEPLVATELGDLLAELPDGFPGFDEAVLERYVGEENRGFTHLPLATVFDGIGRLPPASHVELARDGVATFRTYLSGRRRPGTFGEAIETAVEHYRDDDVALMFSGGVDSVALYLALRATQRNGSCRLVTVETGPGQNNVEGARATAGALGTSLEVYDYGWPFRDEVVLEGVEECLGRDLVDPFDPHYAISLELDGVDAVLSGHNFDSLATVDMRRPPIPRHWDLLLRRDVTHTVMEVVRNAQFSDAYVHSQGLRRLYGRVVPALVDGDLEPDPSAEGTLLGLLSTSKPNLVRPEDAWLAEEVRAYRDYAGRHPERVLLDMLNYHWHMHYWNKVYRTVPAGTPGVDLPSNWGPLLSYYLGKHRGLEAAVGPKRDIYGYVHDRTGRSHFDLKFGSFRSSPRQLADLRRFRQGLRSRLLERNRERLSPDESTVLARVESGALATRLDRLYGEIHGTIGGELPYDDLKHGHRLLNLELLLDRVGE